MSNIIKKLLSLILIIVFCTFSLSGCYNSNNIDNLAYVVAIGFDIGEINNLKISFQIALTSDNDSSSDSSQSSNTVIHTIECATIDSGINLLNSYITKKVDLSNCKAVVFSEELAINGLSKYVYTLINKVQIRPDCNVVISKNNVEYFLENSKPTLENFSARYYETISNSSAYTGYTDNVNIDAFYLSIKDTLINPTAIISAVNESSLKNINPNLDNIDKDSSYVAGETPVSNTDDLENMGLAVFFADTLVGELNGIETICHLIVTNRLKTCNITIPNPLTENENIDLSLNLKHNTKNKVNLVNGSPYINTNISIEAKILSINNDSEYLNKTNLEKIEESVNKYLEIKISDYLYKTSKEFGSDIVGFGKFAVSKFLYWDDWVDYNWLNNYKNSFFTVNVNTNIKSTYMLMSS